MAYEVPKRPLAPILAGVAGLVLLVAAMIPQLWFPDGPLAPTLRLVALFGAAGLLAGALGAFNRWVLANRQARAQNWPSYLASANAHSLEEDDDLSSYRPPSANQQAELEESERRGPEH